MTSAGQTCSPNHEAAIEQLVEARVATRVRKEAWRWRFRLIALETVLIGIAALAAGLAMAQPLAIILKVSLLVAASCFAGGLLLMIATTGLERLAASTRRWLGRRAR